VSWYSFFKYTLVRPFVKVVYRPRVEGEENIPAEGGVVLAANHTSTTETYMMPAMIRRQVTYPAKAELFRGRKGIKGIPSRVVAWAVKAVGQVPLDRAGGRSAMEGLGPVLAVVRGDGVGRRGRHVVVDRRRRAGGGVERGCVEGRELRVLGDVDEDRAGAAGAGEAEGGVEDAGEVRDVAHEVAVLGAGERQAEDVHLLEGVRADER